MEVDIKKCTEILAAGKIILYPTDTIWGLGCDATNEEAVQKIFAIKKRNEQKSLIALLPEATDLLQYLASPPIDPEALIDSFTKPTTIIYPNALGLADAATAADGTMAIRICKDPFCYALLKRFRKPIISTSANISGQDAPRIFAEISDYILQAVDYVVTHRQKDTQIAQASTILKWESETKLSVIRA